MKSLLVLLLILGAGATGYWYGHRAPVAAEAGPEKPADAESKKTAEVTVTPLVTVSIAQTLEVFGLVGPALASELTVSAPYDCVIGAVHVVAGERVSAGDPLVDLSPSPDLLQQLESAKSTLTLAGQLYDDAKARLGLKLATGQELLAAQQARDDAQIKLASLKARGLEGDGKLVAAADGVVSALPAATGTLVSAGAALVTVVTGGRMEARLGVQAGDASQVNSGQPVALFAINRENTASISSEVRLVGGPLDPATGTAEVRVPVPVGATLRLGERVRALIEVRRKTVALVVPRSAVLPDDDKQVLFTVKDGKAVKHEVELGIATEDLLEVLGTDLQEGDSVVTLGNYELEDKMEVKAKDAPPPKPSEDADDDVDPAAGPMPATPEAKP